MALYQHGLANDLTLLTDVCMICVVSLCMPYFSSIIEFLSALPLVTFFRSDVCVFVRVLLWCCCVLLTMCLFHARTIAPSTVVSAVFVMFWSMQCLLVF
jgi:hypothetical protein